MNGLKNVSYSFACFEDYTCQVSFQLHKKMRRQFAAPSVTIYADKPMANRPTADSYIYTISNFVCGGIIKIKFATHEGHEKGEIALFGMFVIFPSNSSHIII